ncbi:hypothetical protein DPMN_061279 [Dreissena polymorpha]|uniref:Uncharacterized protein n=1 Tax=Dreissena polymorpha TaxID=45954 RepID=A0A9D4HGS3_DREPO|nr:hypothetical protein DPMN_061279 [Dreissena polymorpha]
MKPVYKGVRDSCTSALSGAKDKYYQDVVGGAEGNVKQLYKVTSTLLGRSTENQLPPRTDDTTSVMIFSTSSQTSLPICGTLLTKSLLAMIPQTFSHLIQDSLMQRSVIFGKFQRIKSLN